MALEQEIKLSVLEGDTDLTIIDFKAYQQSQISRHRLISRYFDTPDLAIMKRGAGLRMRFDGEQWFQTVKENGQVTNGLHQRQEWEHILTTDEFDLALLGTTPLKKIIENKKTWSTISPIFTTDFVRQTILLTLENQAEIELAYDKGTIYTDEKTTVIHEIELELKAGNVNCLHHLATELGSILPLQATDSSKAKKGYELLSTKVQL